MPSFLIAFDSDQAGASRPRFFYKRVVYAKDISSLSRMSLDLSVRLTIGALEIGTFLSAVLMGAVTVQLYIYYTKNFLDPLWLRCFVSRPFLPSGFTTV